MTTFETIEGDSPVILAQPHVGTQLPDDLWERLNPRGEELADTDWHIDRLYDGLLPGASVIRAKIHRYAIDLNPDPTGASLSPGQNTTDLCPRTDFDNRPIWDPGEEPTAHEVQDRRRLYHAPYHAALAAQIKRVQARHGVAVLWDCHSIRSHVPFLFAGTLPVFNIGTNAGTTCAPSVRQAVEAACKGVATQVSDGRFKGGWTTRHYGNPAKGVHAIQMELAQRAYLHAEAPPWDYDGARAAPIREALSKALATLDALARSGALNP